MACDICGAAKADRKARIEGAVVSVCDKCVTLGDEINIQEIHKLAERILPKLSLPPEFNFDLRPDAAEVVRKGREKLGLTQEQLGEKVSEKVNIIKRVEDGWQPPIQVAKKLEKFLGVSILETAATGNLKTKIDKKQMTLGDMVEIKE